VEGGFNAYGTTPRRLDGDWWAFNEMGGHSVLVQNIVTGEVRTTIPMPAIESNDELSWLEVAGGRIVVLYSGGAAAIADADTGEARLVRPQTCP
jgi:hypothetical protein